MGKKFGGKKNWWEHFFEEKVGGVKLAWKKFKEKKLMGKSLGIKSRRLKLTKKENPNIFTDLLKNFYWMIHLIYFIHLVHLFILFILLDDSPAHM